jgi:hypothetical protein
MGLAATPARRRRHDAIDIPLLAAMTHPLVSQHNLNLAHDWLAWLFEFDDQLDEGAAGLDALSTQRDGQRLLAILCGEPACGDWPLARALQDIWSRLMPMSQPAWHARFRLHVNKYLAANVWESSKPWAWFRKARFWVPLFRAVPPDKVGERYQ